MLKKLALDSYKEALVLTASKGSLEVEEVTKAVASVFTQGKCTSNVKPKEIFMTEEWESEQGPDDEMDEVFEAIAELTQEQDGDGEEMLECFETYKDSRRRVQHQKTSRGFRQPNAGAKEFQLSGAKEFQLSGTLKAKLQQIKQRTRCHVCREFGHWKRECPKKDTTGKASGRATSSGKPVQDALVADASQWMDEEVRELRDALSHEVLFTDESILEVDAMIAQQESSAVGSDTVGEQIGGARVVFPRFLNLRLDIPTARHTCVS